MPDTPRIILHNDHTEKLAAALLARFPATDVRECNDYDALPGLVADFRPDIVYTVRFKGTPGFPADELTGAGGPAWIANGGAGTDHFGAWDPARTTVTNAAGVAADMMAEYVIGAFLHFTLDIPGLQSDKVNSQWAPRSMRPLRGNTLLIVGLGHTGRAVAARARAMGLHVIGTRARPQSMENVDEVHAASDLHQLLPRADFIVISTPLTPQTRGLIGPSEFATMKQGVILADVSRGTVVDQGALLTALQDGTVAASALDVFEVEPLPASNPLWQAENVLISPHSSSIYDGWDAASFELFLDNLGHWINGEPLFNIVDPERGY